MLLAVATLPIRRETRRSVQARRDSRIPVVQAVSWAGCLSTTDVSAWHPKKRKSKKRAPRQSRFSRHVRSKTRLTAADKLLRFSTTLFDAQIGTSSCFRCDGSCCWAAADSETSAMQQRSGVERRVDKGSKARRTIAGRDLRKSSAAFSRRAPLAFWLGTTRLRCQKLRCPFPFPFPSPGQGPRSSGSVSMRYQSQPVTLGARTSFQPNSLLDSRLLSHSIVGGRTRLIRSLAR